MGLSFRQKLGPFNISWSRTKGWNLSAGAGGLRVGANAKGSYLSANKSLGGVRYSKRVSLGTPQKMAYQGQETPARVDIEQVKVGLAIIGAVCFFGLFAFWLISG